MTDSKTANLKDLRGALEAVLESGVPRDDIMTVIIDTFNQPAPTHENGVPGEPDSEGLNGYDESTVFTELPQGLIDFPAAAKKYQLNPWTLHDWVESGHLVLRGRLKAPARGGGYYVVDEAELVHCMANRPRRGRPPNEPVAPDFVSSNGCDENTVFTELPEGLIDIPSASKKYAVKTGILRDLLHRGRLQLRGRLKASAPGGGYLVLSEQQLIDYLAKPKSKGGRPRKNACYC